jgi:hypothetical protein
MGKRQDRAPSPLRGKAGKEGMDATQSQMGARLHSACKSTIVAEG